MRYHDRSTNCQSHRENIKEFRARHAVLAAFDDVIGHAVIAAQDHRSCQPQHLFGFRRQRAGMIRERIHSHEPLDGLMIFRKNPLVHPRAEFVEFFYLAHVISSESYPPAVAGGLRGVYIPTIYAIPHFLSLLGNMYRHFCLYSLWAAYDSSFKFQVSSLHFLATLTLAVHALWIIWMLMGAFLVRGRPRLKIIYIASVALTLFFAFTSGVCPLTDVENYFQERAGSSELRGYEAGFIHHYLSEFVYLGDHFPTLAGLQIILLLLLAIAILINFRRLRF